MMNPASGNYTVPSTCSHGMAWSLPCAACGRPYQPAPEVHYTGSPDPAIAAALNRIGAALERLARVEEDRELRDIAARAPMGGEDSDGRR